MEIFSEGEMLEDIHKINLPRNLTREQYFCDFLLKAERARIGIDSEIITKIKSMSVNSES